MERIYLDHAATTPLSSEARDAMQPWLNQGFGNPSSLYEEGRLARAAIDEAREVVSHALGCSFGELIFTSSGTEASNLAILGSALAAREGKRKRILMGAAEHHAVLHCRPILESLGFQVEEVSVDRFAVLDLSRLESTLGDDVHLVCAMHANNEFGTIQPIREAAVMAAAAGAQFFCDAVQTFGALPWTVEHLGVDMAAVSAHKINGPKGAGALYVKAGTALKPWIVGGGQERELRAGTENVAAIVGFAAAIQRAEAHFGVSADAKRAAREAFYERIETDKVWAQRMVRSVPDAVPCLAGHAHLRFPGLSAESMLISLDRLGVSASSGAACSSGSLEASHVLLAAGYSGSEASEGLRFTFGSNTMPQDTEDAARRVLEAAQQVSSARQGR